MSSDLRTRVMLAAMRFASKRRREVRIEGLTLVLSSGVCNPIPFFGLSFAPLFRAALHDVRGQRVLDVGTGSGVWALMAVREGASVTATDLPHVDLDAIRASADRNQLSPPTLRHGDLFAPVEGERFERILFNPPFHPGQPTREGDAAYLGGVGGEVLRRFLAALPRHLTPTGAAYIILPRDERAFYDDALDALDVTVASSQWLPAAGRVELLSLRA